MSYCLNPSCPKPVNHPKSKKCRSCGSNLLLRNRYHLVKGLGKGGFGATFLAADLSLPGRPLCVIKQLKPNTDNPNFLTMARQLFEREAKTLGRVGNHPQIPRLLDYFEDRNQFYLVQEFVKGNNLQQEIKKNGVLNEEQVLEVLSEILIILRDIHVQKVIHRDIKPANIIRREIDNKLVLIDFGVVKNQVNSAAANEDQAALTAFAVGTPGFAPPEQLAMRPVYASDVYALGVTCMYLMSGKAPKNMDCDPITGDIDWMKYIDVGEDFGDILLKMVEVAVKNRYKTANEALEALDILNHLDNLSDGMLGYNSNVSGASTGSRQSNSRLSSASSGSRRSIYGARRGDSSSSRSAGNGRNKRTASSRSSNLTSRNGSRNVGQRSARGVGRNGRSGSGSATGNLSESKSSRPTKLEGEALLDAYSNGRRDFVRKDLSSQDLPKANLSGINLQSSRLIKLNLQGADLSSSDLTKCDLRQAVLRNANLGRCYFAAANLEGADLRGADLSYANFKETKFKGANLCGANLKNAVITTEQIDLAKTNWTTVFPNGRRGFW